MNVASGSNHPPQESGPTAVEADMIVLDTID
jgi:hypothetical protein